MCNIYAYTRAIYITRVYINYCNKNADLAYATSACVTFSISNEYTIFFTYLHRILKIISIGSTHVDPITATSAYADVACMHYILLNVAYMPRQQCKMCTNMYKIS